jgi:hypothetical protein
MLLRIILRALIDAIIQALKDWRIERDYQEALIENEKFNERQRKAEAAKATTKAVLNVRKASPDDLTAVRQRLRERAERNKPASK